MASETCAVCYCLDASEADGIDLDRLTDLVRSLRAQGRLNAPQIKVVGMAIRVARRERMAGLLGQE
ncbi:MAG: hypothetical protein J2P50_15475 [Hyphomicrobiaceae bacterium]|nr:hypothetical protein [Hyphomicrobiaceae bacterium]